MLMRDMSEFAIIRTENRHMTCLKSLATTLRHLGYDESASTYTQVSWLYPVKLLRSQQMFPLPAEQTACIGFLNVPISSGVCQQLPVANTDVHRVLFTEQDPGVTCPCRSI